MKIQSGSKNANLEAMHAPIRPFPNCTNGWTDWFFVADHRPTPMWKTNEEKDLFGRNASFGKTLVHTGTMTSHITYMYIIYICRCMVDDRLGRRLL